MKRFIIALFATAALALGADIDGTWVAKMETPNGSREVTMKFKAEGDKLTGSISGRQGDTEIKEGKIDGANISFVVVRSFNGNEMKQNYKGTLKGAELELETQMRDNTIKMTARRSAS